MESFEFDLDKALDELEKLEETNTTEINIPVKLTDNEIIYDLLQSLIDKIEQETEVSYEPQEKSEEEKLIEIPTSEPQTENQDELKEEVITESETPPPKVTASSFSIEVVDYKTEWEQLTDNEKTLGLEAPVWLPDSEAESCMKCDLKFTFRKRRHHCRACGLIFCSTCCNLKLDLPYKLNNNSVNELVKKELSRVCVVCYDTINKVNELKSRISLLENTAPIVSVLKKSKSSDRRDSTAMNELENRRKSVRFSDGLLPGQSLNDHDLNTSSDDVIDACKSNYDEIKAINDLLNCNENDQCILFKPIGNLKVYVRLVQVKPDVKCWFYVTNGMCVNAQDELVFLLKSTIDTDQIPKQIIYHIMDLYEKSAKGHRISYMNHLLYNHETEKFYSEILRTNSPIKDTLFDNKDNSAFFYFRPTKFHLTQIESLKPHLPDQPFLFGLLIQKWELPWAKLFPLRLYLRLGEQFNTYPCPIISDPNRKPVYGEIGHTVMSLLSDTRNFQYTIPQIDGVKIIMNDLNTCITIPESQYDFLIKSLLTSNDYVFSFACLQLNEDVVSHLVAIENENLESYSSKTVVYEESNVTGCAFVVFNGAFKTTMTQQAKHTVIEDGLMIQIDIETMNKFKQALQSMKPFQIECSRIQPSHVISIEWSKDDDYLNKHVQSVIDGRPMQGVKSLRLANTIDYMLPDDFKSVKWSEIYLFKVEEDDSSFNLNKFTETVAAGTCMALSPVLNEIVNLSLNKFQPFRVGLRIEINKDQVGYVLGAFKKQINEAKILESLDNQLIQILHQVNSVNVDLLLELVFYVQDKPSFKPR